MSRNQKIFVASSWLAIVVAVVIFAWFYNSDASKEASSQPSPKTQITKKPVVLPGKAYLDRYKKQDGSWPKWLTANDLSPALTQEMIVDFVLPLKTAVLTKYPIDSLREEFARACSDEAVRFSIAFLTDFWESKKEGKSLWVVTVRVDGEKLLIIINDRSLRQLLFTAVKEYPPNQVDAFLEDSLVLISLHEYYHATKQAEGIRGSPTSQEVFQMEAECWAYTCHDLIKVMEDNGRGFIDRSRLEGSVYKAYQRLGGKTDSEEWKETLRKVLPSESNKPKDPDNK